MADNANDADKAGANGGADDNKDTSKQAGNDKAGNDKGANGGDQKQAKPITFESQEDLDEVINTRLARAKKTWEKEKTSKNDGDKDDDSDKKQAKKTAKSDPEKEALRDRARLSDAKDAFIIKTGLPYEKALRVWNLAKSNIEFGDDDKPLNINQTDKMMRDEYPELYPAKVKGKGDGGGGDNKKAAGSSFDNWIRS